MLKWASESLAFYGLDLSRISSVFLMQAYSLSRNRVFDSFDLTVPIKALEGLDVFDGTPQAMQFKHPPLKGLYKKHFSSPRFLVKNLLNFHLSKEGKEHFQRTWDQALSSSESEYLDEKFINYLVHEMTIPPIGIKSRTHRITGEWVVFHKHAGRNYYLTIAGHHETNDEIYKRTVLACDFDGFPFQV